MAYIYLIGTETRCKIGVSKDVQKRMKTLQTGNPEPLHLYYFFEVEEDRKFRIERHIQKELGYLKTKGEWFNITPDFGINFLKFAEIRWKDDILI